VGCVVAAERKREKEKKGLKRKGEKEMILLSLLHLSSTV
jgi:hypothetical protein